MTDRMCITCRSFGGVGITSEDGEDEFGECGEGVEQRGHGVWSSFGCQLHRSRIAAPAPPDREGVGAMSDELRRYTIDSDPAPATSGLLDEMWQRASRALNEGIVVASHEYEWRLNLAQRDDIGRWLVESRRLAAPAPAPAEDAGRVYVVFDNCDPEDPVRAVCASPDLAEHWRVTVMGGKSSVVVLPKVVQTSADSRAHGMDVSDPAPTPGEVERRQTITKVMANWCDDEDVVATCVDDLVTALARPAELAVPEITDKEVAAAAEKVRHIRTRQTEHPYDKTITRYDMDAARSILAAAIPEGAVVLGPEDVAAVRDALYLAEFYDYTDAQLLSGFQAKHQRSRARVSTILKGIDR